MVARIVPFVVLLVAGTIVLLLSSEGSIAFIVGFVLAGLGAVLLVSLAFYEVGRSEDRARERDRSG